MPIFTWNATETESINPFRTAHEALAGCSVRLSLDDVFSDAETWVVEDSDSIQPELKILIDESMLIKDCGIAREDIQVSLLARDRELNRFMCLDTWSLDEVPQDPYCLKQVFKSEIGSSRTDLVVCITPNSTRDRGDEIASSSYSIVAEKTFKLRVLNKRSKFPKRWASANEFEELGLSGDTIFWVEWLAEDLDRHPSCAFIVWLNEGYKEQIKSFQVGGAAGELLGVDMTTMILTEISSAVLKTDQDGADPIGTIRIVEDLLHAVNGLKLAEMRARFEGHDGYSILRIWAQQVVNAPGALGALDFIGGKK